MGALSLVSKRVVQFREAWVRRVLNMLVYKQSISKFLTVFGDGSDQIRSEHPSISRQVRRTSVRECGHLRTSQMVHVHCLSGGLGSHIATFTGRLSEPVARLLLVGGHRSIEWFLGVEVHAVWRLGDHRWKRRRGFVRVRFAGATEHTLRWRGSTASRILRR